MPDKQKHLPFNVWAASRNGLFPRALNGMTHLLSVAFLATALCPHSILADSISDFEAKTGQKLGTPAQTAPASTAKVITRQDVVGYAVIPLRGEFGIEIDERIFQASLEACKRQGVHHIFIPIDSSGGSVKTAMAIADLMDKSAKDFKYHVWVEKKALSASICVVFSADTIHVSGDATIGAATAYSKDDAGVAQVSAKFNSAWAAGIAVMAERKGWSPAMVRAMVQEGAEAYAWKDADGKWSIGSAKPANPSGEFVTLSNGKTILTLTSAEAREIGFAQGCVSLDEAVQQVGEKRLLKVTVYPEQLALFYGAECAVARIKGFVDPHRLVNFRGQEFSEYDMFTTILPVAVDAVKEFPKLNGLLPANPNAHLELGTLTSLISDQRGVAQVKIAKLQYGFGSPDTDQIRALYTKAATVSAAVCDRWKGSMRQEFERCWQAKEAAMQPRVQGPDQNPAN